MNILVGKLLLLLIYSHVLLNSVHLLGAVWVTGKITRLYSRNLVSLSILCNMDGWRAF
jgi:hypothetical protein